MLDRRGQLLEKWTSCNDLPAILINRVPNAMPQDGILSPADYADFCVGLRLFTSHKASE